MCWFAPGTRQTTQLSISIPSSIINVCPVTNREPSPARNTYTGASVPGRVTQAPTDRYLPGHVSLVEGPHPPFPIPRFWLYAQEHQVERTWQLFMQDPNGVEVELDFDASEMPPADWKEHRGSYISPE